MTHLENEHDEQFDVIPDDFDVDPTPDDGLPDAPLIQRRENFGYKLIPYLIILMAVLGLKYETDKAQEQQDKAKFASCTATWIVKQGDTVTKIAESTGNTVEELVQENNLSNPDFIVVDQVLCIKESNDNNPSPSKINGSDSETSGQEKVNEPSIDDDGYADRSNNDPISEQFWESEVFKTRALDFGVDLDELLEQIQGIDLDELNPSELLIYFWLVVAVYKLIDVAIPEKVKEFFVTLIALRHFLASRNDSEND